jgi:hypothetical protein
MKKCASPSTKAANGTWVAAAKWSVSNAVTGSMRIASPKPAQAPTVPVPIGSYHLAEKTWIDLDDLIIAWLCAVRVAGTDLGKIDVYASIAEARTLHARMVKEGAEEQEMERKAGYLPGEPVTWTFINGELQPMPKVTQGG